MSNIAVVVLDTLRYDTFNQWFSWLDGIRFNNAYSTSHWTGSAHASILTGAYPSEVGVSVKSRSLDCNRNIITEALQSAGYTTRIITSNPQIYEWEGWERGFDHRLGPRNMDILPIPEGVPDFSVFDFQQSAIEKMIDILKATTDEDASFIKTISYALRLYVKTITSVESIQKRMQETEISEPEFVLINIMDAHGPYITPRNYRSVKHPQGESIEDAITNNISKPENVIQAYNDCGNYLSQRYQELHKQLLQTFDYVITVSDHGELLGEHGGLWGHQYGIFPELTHVPMVISGNDINDDDDESVVSILDIHKTVADLADIDIHSRGQNLLNDLESIPRLVEYHGLAPERKQKFRIKGILDEFNSYDVPLDGIVTNDGYAYQTVKHGLKVVGSTPKHSMEDELYTLLSNIDRKRIVTEDHTFTQDTKNQLKRLGYL